MLVNCDTCGKEFRAKPRDKRRYCSSDCYHTATREVDRAERTKFECKNCGVPFWRAPGELRSYVAKFGRPPLYCSIPCSAVGRRADTDADVASKTNCVVCGAAITRARRPGGTIYRLRRICSSECRRKFKLAEHERLRPADEREVQRHVTSQGYIRLRFPNKNGVKGREVLEHRLVMEQHLGRELLPEETVHHKNGDRAFNDLSNIELFSSRHGPGQRVIDKVAFAIEMMTLYPDFVAEAGYKLVKVDGEERAHQ